LIPDLVIDVFGEMTDREKQDILERKSLYKSILEDKQTLITSLMKEYTNKLNEYIKDTYEDDTILYPFSSPTSDRSSINQIRKLLTKQMKEMNDLLYDKNKFYKGEL
jgi:hypothetical protein